MRWGTDSPVSGDVSTCESPSSTVPSSGIFSPGRKNVTAGAKGFGFHISSGAVVQHFVGNAWPGGQQSLDRPTRTPGGALLHKFTHAVKQHDANGFRQLPEGYGSDCCAAHEREFVEKVLLQDALRPYAQDIITTQYIWQGVEDANDQPVGHDLGKTFIRDHTNGEKHGGYCHNGDFAPFVVVPVFMLVPMIMAAGAGVIMVAIARFFRRA